MQCVFRRVAVLYSGGLDSSILVSRLVASGLSVSPIYFDSSYFWQKAEMSQADKALRAFDHPSVDPLVRLELPLADVFPNHWSVNGDGVPSATSDDRAVDLPGRNTLAIVKAALWCQAEEIQEIALATLGSSPFADATPNYMTLLGTTLQLGLGREIKVTTPLFDMRKADLMRAEYDFPLGETFSCLAPVDTLHCGRCNKCEERRLAFESAGITDPTQYASQETHRDPTHSNIS